MPLVVNGVCRFTVQQRLFTEVVANVLDMRIDTTGTTTDRDDAITDQAQVILRQWRIDILPFQINNLQLESVSFVDLDSATGATGSVTSEGSGTYPASGSNTGDAMPGSVSALVRKNLSTSARGRRSGRMYLGGLAEAFTEVDNGNLLTAAVVSGLNTGLGDFLGNVNQNGSSIYQYDSAMCVVHVETRDENGKPLTGSSDDVSSLECQQLLGSQRRRGGR